MTRSCGRATSRAAEVTPILLSRVPGQRRRRTRGQSPTVLRTAPTSGASQVLPQVGEAGDHEHAGYQREDEQDGRGRTLRVLHRADDVRLDDRADGLHVVLSDDGDGAVLAHREHEDE